MDNVPLGGRKTEHISFGVFWSGLFNKMFSQTCSSFLLAVNVKASLDARMTRI